MKINTKNIKAFIFCAIIVLAFSSFKANTVILPKNSPAAINGKLQVIGNQLSNQKGQPVILRGTSFGWHCFRPRFYTDSAVNWLATDWKCSVVRVAMGVGPDNSYLQNPVFANQCVTRVVDAAIRKGIYVLIDFHSHNLYTSEAKKFFTEMATKYKDAPNVIYEIYNEPDKHATWIGVKKYSEEVISTIRAIDSDNIILVGSPHWDTDLDSVAADPILGQTNIMYTMHFYAATHKNSLRDKADVALAAKLPIFVSECAGMQSSGDGAIDSVEWNEYVNWMESKKISWIVWSVSDKNETCSMLTPQAASTGNWKDDSLKEWGKICKRTIQSLNTKK